MMWIIVLIAALTVVVPVGAQDLNIPPEVVTKLKEYHPETVLATDGQPSAAIIYPDEPGYAELAAQVVEVISDASGAELPMKTSGEYVKTDRDVNLICLGRMNNNELALDLFSWRLVASDDWFPGPAGFELRTVHDPWGNGRNVVMLGGSDLDGVRMAVERFTQSLPQGETLSFPRTIVTQFDGIEHLDSYTDSAVERFETEFVDLQALPYQSEKLMFECAEMYLLTGAEEYAEVYSRMLRRWMDEYYRYTLERQINTPKYMVPWVLVSFASIEESPLIPAQTKLDLINLIYDYCSRLALDTGRIAGLRPDRFLSTGMHEVSESIIYGAQYLRKYYPDLDFDHIDAGVEQVMIGQRTMAASNGFIDNNGGYTAFYPQTAMRLALVTGDHSFFESGAARRWMEYSMLVTNSSPSTFFSSSVAPDAKLHARHCMPAWYYNDPHYLWFSNWREGRSDYHPHMTEDTFDYWVWTYLPKIEPLPPVDAMVGLKHMTLHELNYRQLEDQGRFVNVPRERTFHQLAMREGLEREDQYLRLDGINDGITNGGDGNAIAVVSDGRSWLTNTGKWGGGRNMKWFNTALVLRQGQMADRLVALCDLQLKSEFPDSAFVRSVMSEYHGVDWARNIAWVKGKYWVVLDQFLAQEADDYSIMCQWYTGGDSVDDEQRVRVTVADHTFVLQAAGGNRPFITYLEDGRSIVRQAVHDHLEIGDEVTMAHLMYGHANESPEGYSIERIAANEVRVNEPDRQVLIGVRPLGDPEPMALLEGRLSASCVMYTMAIDELTFSGLTELQGEGVPLLEGEGPVDLHVDLTSGVVTATASEATALRPAGAGTGEITVEPGQPRELATLEGDALTTLSAAVETAVATAAPAAGDPADQQMAEHPARLTEQWRYLIPDADGDTVSTIKHADLTGDGVPEILLGTNNGRLFSLNADGSERWQMRFEPHPDQPSSRGQNHAAVNDIAVADFGEGPRILVASDSQYLHCFDADGNEQWKFTGVGVELKNQAPGLQGSGRYREGDGEMMAVEVVDVDGDGTLDILAGSKTYMHGSRRVYGTLWRLDPSGTMVWHLFQSAGTVTNIATLDPDGDGRRLIYFGTGGGTYGGFAYLCDHDGAFLGSMRGPHGETYVGAGQLGADQGISLLRFEQRDGTVYVHDAKEPWERRWIFRAGGLSAVGPELTDLTGDGSLETVVGSDGGSVFCLTDADDPVMWTSTVGEPISAITVGRLTEDSQQIVAGSWAGGLTAVSADGAPVAYARVGAPVESVAIVEPDAGRPGLVLAGSSDGAVSAFALQ